MIVRIDGIHITGSVLHGLFRRSTFEVDCEKRGKLLGFRIHVIDLNLVEPHPADNQFVYEDQAPPIVAEHYDNKEIIANETNKFGQGPRQI